MQKLECKTAAVCLAPAGELLRENPPADYLIAQTDFTKTDEIAELLSNGYRFHDRLFEVAVSDKTLNANINCGDVSRINFRETDAASDEMYKLAYSSFHDDRRFFLDLDFENKEQAREVIGAYIRECMKFGGKIIYAEYKNELLGYLLTARLQERERERDGAPRREILLGMTKHTMLGKMIAYPLYAKAVELYGGYCGKVSSTNIASLSLQTRLGARIIGVEDRYILRQNQKL